jgi:hypothetical protein
VQGWTVTTNGPYSSQPYFLRLSKTGDPDAAIVYNLGNGSISADQRAVVDETAIADEAVGELGVPAVLDEGNSVVCEGEDGVSNVFASAL